MKETIFVKDLTHDYNGLRAVDQISFTVGSGEIFGFLGPNGAGKTTTINILTGLLIPTAGQARVAGCDVVKQRDQLKSQIGVVFEHQNLYETLNALDNLNFIAGLYGVPRRRSLEVLQQVGLAERAKDKIKKYSNGMKQRLMIARALIHQPSVLFLDEPTRGLDPNVARSIRSLIRELSNQGMTVFLTTHYMEEADQLCHRVALLDHGRIVALNTPSALKEAHSDNGSASLEDVFVTLTGKELTL